MAQELQGAYGKLFRYIRDDNRLSETVRRDLMKALQSLHPGATVKES